MTDTHVRLQQQHCAGFVGVEGKLLSWKAEWSFVRDDVKAVDGSVYCH